MRGLRNSVCMCVIIYIYCSSCVWCVCVSMYVGVWNVFSGCTRIKEHVNSVRRVFGGCLVVACPQFCIQTLLNWGLGAVNTLDITGQASS